MRELLSYVVAGIAFTALGIWNQNFIYSFFEGLGFILFCMVALPALYRRYRRP